MGRKANAQRRVSDVVSSSNVLANDLDTHRRRMNPYHWLPILDLPVSHDISRLVTLFIQPFSTLQAALTLATSSFELDPFGKGVYARDFRANADPNSRYHRSTRFQQDVRVIR